MALVASPIVYKGPLGNMSFYVDHQGRCIARQKQVRSEDYLKHPNRKGQLNSVKEFGSASTIAAAIRTPFADYIKFCSDASYFNRLMSLLRHAANQDHLSEVGQRQSTRGNIFLLEGFEFNKNRHLQQALNADVVTHYDEQTREVKIDIQPFCPKTHIHAPKEARFFQVVAVANVAGHRQINPAQEVSNLIDVRSTELQSISLRLQPTQEEGELLTISLGVIFYEEYMGHPLLIRDGTMSILEVYNIRQEPPLFLDSTGKINDKVFDQQSQQTLQQGKELRLRQKYKSCKVISGDTNKTPFGNLKPDYTQLKYHLENQKLEKLRKG